jgi:very-short-patch-repair endonuclease
MSDSIPSWQCAICQAYNSFGSAACNQCEEQRPPANAIHFEDIEPQSPLGLELLELSTPSAAKRGKRPSKPQKGASEKAPKLTEEQDLEEKFYRYWLGSDTGYELTRQHRGIFKHVNKRGKLIMTNHRFDFALPALKLAIEVQGGIFSRGRHVRPQGYHDDRAKMRKAQAQGWVVFEFTTLDIKDNNLHNVVHEILAEVKTLETIYVEKRKAA